MDLVRQFLETCDGVLTLESKSRVPGTLSIRDFLVMGRCRGRNRVILFRWVDGGIPAGAEIVDESAAIRDSRKAHLCVVCTRGRFEKEAVYLASLKDVTLVRALPTGRKIRFVQDFAVLAKFLSVDKWALRLYRSRGDKSGQVIDSESPALSHDGCRVSNWLRCESIKLLQRCESDGHFEAKYVLRSAQTFLFSRKKVIAERLEAWIQCRVRYAYQVDSMEFEETVADHGGNALGHGVMEYPAESWNGLEFDKDNPPNPARLRLVFMEPVAGGDGKGTSKLNKLVRSRSIAFIP